MEWHRCLFFFLIVFACVNHDTDTSYWSIKHIGSFKFPSLLVISRLSIEQAKKFQGEANLLRCTTLTWFLKLGKNFITKRPWCGLADKIISSIPHCVVSYKVLSKRIILQGPFGSVPKKIFWKEKEKQLSKRAMTISRCCRTRWSFSTHIVDDVDDVFYSAKPWLFVIKQIFIFFQECWIGAVIISLAAPQIQQRVLSVFLFLSSQEA